MARPLRLSFENAVYHITARGNRKENIFYSDKDRMVFQNKMNETFEKYSFICYAYCLMDNHYHLFIKTPIANISQGMHYLNSSYANWFKTKYEIVGVVFQGRYKSILVDADSYALELSAYIHLNPLRSELVKDIEEFRWGSYLNYIGKRKSHLKNLDTNFILGQFDNDIRKAQQSYKRYLLEKTEMKNPLKEVYKGFVLGSEDYIEEIEERIESVGQNREIPETRYINNYTPKVIFNTITKICNIRKGEIFQKRKGNIYRQLAIYLIKNFSALPIREIGNLFDIDYVTVSITSKRFDENLRKNRRLSTLRNSIIKALDQM